MATTMRRTNRTATPARWQAALARSQAEGVTVRQLAGCGARIATSGTDTRTAYELAVSGGVAHGCTCPAGEHADPVCKDLGALYLAAGLIHPEPPTPAAPALLPCPACDGHGWDWAGTGYEVEQLRVTCVACSGSGWAEEVDDDEPAIADGRVAAQKVVEIARYRRCPSGWRNLAIGEEAPDLPVAA